MLTSNYDHNTITLGLKCFVHCQWFYLHWTKKWSFTLKVYCGFGHIYWRNPKWKTSFSVQCFLWKLRKNMLNFLSDRIGILLEIIYITQGIWCGSINSVTSLTKTLVSSLFPTPQSLGIEGCKG